MLDAAPAVFAEGCLSIPGYAATVSRALRVRVDALDHHGQPLTIEAAGWYARILQHEIDHLQGTLYIDRMDTRTFTSLRQAERPPEPSKPREHAGWHDAQPRRRTLTLRIRPG